LQLRYIVLITILSAVISTLLGYTIWLQEKSASQVIVELGTGTFAQDDNLREAITSRLASDDFDLIITMVGVAIGLILVLSMYMTLLTHRVAGPLYKVSKYLDQMAAGRIGAVRDLRKHDMLKDFYEQFRSTHQTVRARFEAENRLVRRFLEACQNAQFEDPPLKMAMARLSAHHDQRQKALASE
jgi:hypothetical protein